MITSNIEWNNLHVKLIESIEGKWVTQVPPPVIWLQRQRKRVCNPLDHTYRDDRSGSDANQRLTMVASRVQGLHRRLISLPNTHRTSSLTYQPCWKRLNQGKKCWSSGFSILDNNKTLKMWRECIQQWTYSGYPDLSPCREALYHFLVAYALSTLWTLCNEPWELPACLIDKMSPELLLHSPRCIFHRSDDWTPDRDECCLWSWQISSNRWQCDSVATLLALHTTQPSLQGSWYLVVGFSSYL